MAFKVAEKFPTIHPDVALTMPLAKILFYHDVMRVLSGEIIPERIMNKDDVKLMEHITENKDELRSIVDEMINDYDNKVMGVNT